jgi:hypothetical protein
MRSALVLAATLSASAVAFAGCGGGGSAKEVQSASGSKDPSQWPTDDRSMCVYKNRPDVEVSEIASQGALRPTIRRVFKIVGDAEHQHRVIECREADTNLDGIKDVVRTFNAKASRFTKKPTVTTMARSTSG